MKTNTKLLSQNTASNIRNLQNLRQLVRSVTLLRPPCCLHHWHSNHLSQMAKWPNGRIHLNLFGDGKFLESGKSIPPRRLQCIGLSVYHGPLPSHILEVAPSTFTAVHMKLYVVDLQIETHLPKFTGNQRTKPKTEFAAGCH